MDASMAILNAVLADVVDVLPSPGYNKWVEMGKSLLLLKELYGLKQSSGAWNQKLERYLIEKAGMKPINADKCIYTRYINRKLDIEILIYIDDIIIMESDDRTTFQAKKVLRDRFKIADVRMIRWVLGMNVEDREEGIYIKRWAIQTTS